MAPAAPSSRPAADSILAAYDAQLDAMVAGDTAALGILLSDDFTLTHISGYRQPKAEWLHQMDAGQFRYHSIERQGDPTVTGSGDSATLTHRIITDATVYGSRNRWRLAFTQTFEQTDGHWLSTGSVATTW
jgi:ketosteroid isomerase-like protein